MFRAHQSHQFNLFFMYAYTQELSCNIGSVHDFWWPILAQKKHQQSKTILAWVILYLFYLWGHAEVCLSYSSGLENSVIVIFIDIFSSFTCMKNVVKL